MSKIKDISLNLINSIESLCLENNNYLGNKGYTIYKKNLSTSIINNIKKELTVKAFTINAYNDNSLPYPIFLESQNKLYVPRFWGIKYFGLPNEIKISYGININFEFKGILRKEPIDQNEIVNTYLDKINFNKKLSIEDNDKINKGNSCGLINLKTGGGKTVLGLYILSLIKKKTIIFVHKTFLKDQWIERINQFLPFAKIGSIQGPIIDIEDKDIVIAMIQSISMKDYPEKLFDDFGFSIYDEVHHLSSEVFSNCLKKCNTLYSLGLSATMERKDGLSFVFKLYLGDICKLNYDVKKDQDDVLVKVIDYEVKGDEYFITTELDYKGNPKYSTMISKLSNYIYRNDFIVNIIHNEFKININQQMMILCHTRSMLQYLFNKINELATLSVGFYIGGMKKDDLKISESKQVILATYQMAAEALDIKSLTSLLLATPKTDIVQAVGRILREKHKNPLVIDIVDTHNCFQNQFNKRKTFYNKNNYKILRINSDNYLKNDNYLWSDIKKKSKKLDTKEDTQHEVEKKCLI